MRPKPLNILLVEDDIIEIMKFESIIRNIEIKHSVVIVRDGEEAIAILKERGYTPDIIISDLAMPKVNGIEFLRKIKRDSSRKYIPIIMLTTSSNPDDINECYRLGVSSYILKPLKHQDYIANTTKMIEYWSTNELIYN